MSGLRAALLRRPELFVGTLTEKLLTYALGRGLDFDDAPAVRKIVAVGARRQDYRFSSLVLGIVTSDPFQMRSVAMIVTKIGASRGARSCAAWAPTLALPLLDAMVPALSALARSRWPARSGGSATSTSRWG